MSTALVSGHIHTPVIGARSETYVGQERQRADCIFVAVIRPDTLMLLPKFYCFVGRAWGKGSDIG